MSKFNKNLLTGFAALATMAGCAAPAPTPSVREQLFIAQARATDAAEASGTRAPQATLVVESTPAPTQTATPTRTPEATANPTVAPAKEAEKEIHTWSVKPGINYALEPGLTANGGHLQIRDQDGNILSNYPNETNQVIVIRNTGKATLFVYAPADGMGITNSTDPEIMVNDRLEINGGEGCDDNGCGKVVDVYVDKNGKLVKRVVISPETIDFIAVTPTATPKPEKAGKDCPEGPVAPRVKFDLLPGCHVTAGIITLPNGIEITTADYQMTDVRNNAKKTVVGLSSRSGATLGSGSTDKVWQDGLSTGCGPRGCYNGVIDFEYKDQQGGTVGFTRINRQAQAR